VARRTPDGTERGVPHSAPPRCPVQPRLPRWHDHCATQPPL